MQLEQALAQDSTLSPATREALKGLVDYLRKEEAANKAAPTSFWPEGLRLSGELRMRHVVSTHLDNLPTRQQSHVRARLGATYNFDPEFQVGARLSTSDSSDPNTAWIGLGDVFDTFPIAFDRAFLAYAPEWCNGSKLTVGKFGHAFYANPVYGEMVWDADVQPEGAALGLEKKDVLSMSKLELQAGYYVVSEQRIEGESSAYVAQVSSQFQTGEKIKSTAALGVYHYTDLTPDGSQQVVSENSGNVVVGAAPNLDFESRFTIWNPILTTTYDGFSQPLTLSGEYILNPRAKNDQDRGYVVGVQAGRQAKRGDYRIYYQWQVIEQDAVLSVVAQDDALFQTNHRTHIFGVDYLIRDRLLVRLWALVSAREDTSPGLTTDSDKDQWRVRADLAFRF